MQIGYADAVATPEPQLAKWQLELLHQPVAHLATVDTQARPHNVPICFVYLDGRIYTAVDHKPKRAQPLDLRRVRNLLANPNVCLTVDRYDEDWSRLAWLQVRGQARLLDDPAQRIRAIEALRGKYAQYRTMDLERRPMIEIRPSDVRAWRASEHEPGSIRS
jgi:PPOX class probable F420-dependent enzyme